MLEEDKKEAIEFAGSIRGTYIISQALTKAIEVMEKEPFEKLESSNIADMKFLKRYLFNVFPIVEKSSNGE